MRRHSGDAPDIRIVCARSRADYAAALGATGSVTKDYQGDTWPGFNRMPGESLMTVYRAESGKVEIGWSNWGYAPDNELGKQFGPQPFAQVETAPDKPYFSEAWLTRRRLVCACGWTVIRGKGDDQEAWHVRPRDGKPVFLLALGDPVVHCTVKKVAVLLAPAPGMLAELAPRVPVTVPGEHARFWLDPGLVPHEQFVLANRTMMGNAFEWAQVTKHAVNPRMDGPALLKRAPKMSDIRYGADWDEWWEKPRENARDVRR
ncbi:Putative SOS response-associated peptidase YedK [Pandoraea capi]|uniref:SOS response-associated peptidase YedK n=1 Tax=Pandoraea capi TaxID=2508286 RepID=A0ABY6W130_9BURK|nr:SOS response-associated peptidase family protein [Pandoraea capi]VVE13319.1 Putative SOS response-associated peptidase YedK [Pandoraea capi]